MPLGTQIWHEGLERASRVARFAEQLDQEGWRPDLILAHSGWGETLGLQEVWPNVPQILWPELVGTAGAWWIWDRPDEAVSRVLITGWSNLVVMHSLVRPCPLLAIGFANSTSGRESCPSEFRDQRLHVIHEGIDTRLAHPNPEVSFEVRGVHIDRTVPTITFVNRNLERLRGFDVFMRSLPLSNSNMQACVS